MAIVRHRPPFRACLRSHRCQNGSTQIGFLDAIHGRGFSRKVGTDGVVDVDDEHSSIQQALAGQRVVLFVSAPDRTFEVWLDGRLIKSLPRKRPGWPADDLAEVGGIHEGASPLGRTSLVGQAAPTSSALAFAPESTWIVCGAMTVFLPADTLSASLRASDPTGSKRHGFHLPQEVVS